MAEIVNLRLARKAKARTDKERAAEANRIVHGRLKAETERQKRLRAVEDQRLDGHKLGPHEP